MNNTDKNPIHEGATVASILHDRMVRTGATESDVAELLGIDQTQIGRWRRGRTVPRVSALSSMAEWLNVDIVELEAAREESERVRAEVAARKVGGSPKVNLAKMQSELKAKDARIKWLEMQLADDRPTWRY